MNQLSATIHLTLIDLSQVDEQRLLRERHILDAQEAQRHQRLRHPKHRQRFLAAHVAMRHVLGAATGRSPAELRFVAGEFGKPSLTDVANLGFSLSHSGDWALLAVGDSSLGVDIEAWIERPSELLANQILNPDELAAWAGLPEAERSPALTHAWTAREALLKADGGGLRWDLQRARLPAELPGWAEISGQASRWWLQSLEVPQGFAGCLACPDPIPVIQSHAFDWGQIFRQ